jgi:ABC-type dipeptide/oligopeptide/nickel transport system permease subunit
MTSAAEKSQRPTVAVLNRAPLRQRSLYGDALRRLSRNPLALVGAAIVLALALTAVFADQISPYSPTEVNLELYVQPPSAEHPLGTDDVGRDIMSRIIHGARTSLRVSLLSMVIGLVVGTLVGLVAGYYGGATGTLMMRLTDVFLAFPLLLLAIALVAALGPSENSVFLALSIVIWPYVARLARGQALALRNYEFVTAAHALGASDIHILIVHILPNMLTPLIVYGTLTIANIILAEAALAFLGLGAQPPTPSWGGMLSDTRSFLLSAPWLPTFPGIFIFLAALGFNLLGDGLRDALDVKQ